MLGVAVLVFAGIPARPARPPSAVAAARGDEAQRGLGEYCASVVEMCAQPALLMLSLGSVQCLYLVASDVSVLRLERS
jgi:hypothetical protein